MVNFELIPQLKETMLVVEKLVVVLRGEVEDLKEGVEIEVLEIQ
jgi:hypothetical protein